MTVLYLRVLLLYLISLLWRWVTHVPGRAFRSVESMFDTTLNPQLETITIDTLSSIYLHTREGNGRAYIYVRHPTMFRSPTGSRPYLSESLFRCFKKRSSTSRSFEDQRQFPYAKTRFLRLGPSLSGGLNETTKQINKS